MVRGAGAEHLKLAVGRAIDHVIEPFGGRAEEGLEVEAAFKGATRQVQTFLVTLLSAIVVSFLAWRLFEQGSYYGDTGEVLDIVRVPIALFSYYMSLAAGIAAAIMFAMLVQGLRRPPS